MVERKSWMRRSRVGDPLATSGEEANGGPPSPPARPKVSVIVPAYNEAPTLFENLSRLAEHLDRSPFTSEMIVVDDGSADHTAAEASRFAESRRDVKVVEHQANFGLGQAIKSGLRASSGDIIVTFDADLSYDPEHIDRLVGTMETTGASIVVASPYMEGGSVIGVPRMRAILSRWANRMLRRLSLHHISTVTGMVRAYDAEFVDGLSLKSMDNQINAEIIYKATILRRPIVEIPAQLQWTRNEDETRTRSKNLRFVTMTIDSMFSGFIFRPFTFFLLPGVVLGGLALYTLGWAAYHVITFLPDQSGSPAEMIADSIAAAFQVSPHSIVVGGIALILSFQLISVGILSAQNKRYFEEVWYQGDLTARELRRPGGRSARLADGQGSELTG
jgi:glycosyltransferase involved in cell wall biosynthesis